jgi:hypothetical protein
MSNSRPETLSSTVKRPPNALRGDYLATPKSMTDDTEDRSADHQHAVEACQHAADTLVTGDL